MDSDSIIRILLLVILILLSGFFSATETAYSAMSRIRLKNMAENGNKKAERTLNISENFDLFLSTVLVGNNIVNITATAIATILFVNLWPNTGATISTVVMTVLVLIFGEVSPKSLAKEKPESFAMAVSGIVKVLEWILFPITWFFTQWKKLLMKLFQNKEKQGITDDELLTIVDEAENGGNIGEDEGDLIRSAIEFTDEECSDVLTPRVDIVAVEETDPIDEILNTFVESAFSRIPVYAQDLDNIIGVLNYKDFYEKVLVKKESLQSAISDVVRVSPDTKISKLLKMLQKEKTHMSVVIDEYGGTVGIVTMEDILEELVGEIWDEHDEVVLNIIPLENGKMKVLCSMSLPDFFEYFDIKDEDEATTVGGWVMEKLGKIPEINDSFIAYDLRVVVMKMDQRKPLEIEVERIQEN